MNLKEWKSLILFILCTRKTYILYANLVNLVNTNLEFALTLHCFFFGSFLLQSIDLDSFSYARI